MKHKSWIIGLLLPLLFVGCSKERPPTIEEIKDGSVTVESRGLFDDEKSSKSEVFMSPTIAKLPGILPESDRLNKAVRIKTKKGEITFLLLGDEAPLTVSNFVWLARQKFYDGLTFHRVEPGFVIQGGDPKGNGTGGPGYHFDDEPVKRSYVAGAVAMANSGPNTNGSQFFITLADLPRLPPNYTIFGIVVRGMDVALAITPGDVMTSVEILDVKTQ